MKIPDPVLKSIIPPVSELLAMTFNTINTVDTINTTVDTINTFNTVDPLDIKSTNILLASCQWGPATAHRVCILTEMYVIYMEVHLASRCHQD